MGLLLEAVKKQIIQTKDPELAYLVNEIADKLSECPTTENEFKFPSRAVIILKSKNDDDDDTDAEGKYLIDYDTLARFASDNKMDIPAAYQQVIYDNKLNAENCAVLINNVNLDNIFESIVNSPTKDEYTRRKVALEQYSTFLHQLTLNDIKIVKTMDFE